MEILKLKARFRQGVGKSYTRKVRKYWIPAVLYGRGQKTDNIEIDAAEFGAVVRAKKTTHLFDLGLPGRSELVAVIKEIQRDVIKDSLFYHIDFQAVSMNEKISVVCPVEIVGVPVGVKEEGGVLENPVKSLHIECLPMDIPEKIVVDVSGLHVNQSIHVKDIRIEKVDITDSPEEVVALVTRIKEEKAAATAVGAEAASETAGQSEAAPVEASSSASDTKKDEKPKDKKEK